MHPRYQLYLVPRGNGIYLLGATQIESEDFSPISVRSALELLSALYSLHEGFAEARITGYRSNCRPALPDNLPAVALQPGLLRINGLFRHGFLLAPVLARAVAAYLRTGNEMQPEWAEIMHPIDADSARKTLRRNFR
jgi:glycine oxidase